MFVSQKHVDNDVNGAAWEKALRCYINMKRYNEALATLDTITLHFPEYENGTLKRAFILDKMDKIGAEGVAGELEEMGYTRENVDTYLKLFDEVETDLSGVRHLKERLGDFLSSETAEGMEMIMSSVEAAKECDFKLKFDPTLVRGCLLYTSPSPRD